MRLQWRVRCSVRACAPDPTPFIRSLMTLLKAARLKRFSRPALIAATLAAAVGSPAHADQTLDKINARHEIAVGVLIAGSPFGSLDPQTQQPRGINVDLANDIGKRLGVKVQLV